MVLFYRKQPHVNTVAAAIRQNIMTTCLIGLLVKQHSSRPLKVCWANWGQHGHPGWSLAKQTPKK